MKFDFFTLIDSLFAKNQLDNWIISELIVSIRQDKSLCEKTRLVSSVNRTRSITFEALQMLRSDFCNLIVALSFWLSFRMFMLFAVCFRCVVLSVRFALNRFAFSS